MRHLINRFVQVFGALALVPGTGFAVDGVIEINHAAALAGGVTPGDAPGFPVTITRSGSYRLTSNLVGGHGYVIGNGLDMVEITADNVDLDLNGFTIERCRATGPIHNCLGSVRTGVYFSSGKGGAVRNGTIARMGLNGVFASTEVRLENLALIENGNHGAWIGSNGVVESVIAHENGNVGITGNFGANVRDSSATENANAGMSFTSATRIHACTSRDNGSHGFSMGERGLLTDSVSTGNGGNGVSAGRYSLISGSNASANDLDGVHSLLGLVTVNSSVMSDNARAGFDGNGSGSANVLKCNGQPSTGLTDVTPGSNLDVLCVEF